ncbi:hypothetical protein C6366_07470 [Desulfonatronum sp. SC1]|nr:hypothetical protein C6366_07470 [Desulfonatronum sp. SC1]
MEQAPWAKVKTKAAARAVDHAAKVNKKPAGKVADAIEDVLQAALRVAPRARLRALRPNLLNKTSARGRTNGSEPER